MFLGILTNFVLALGTDQLLHVLQVYPPWGQPMYEGSLNLLALSYRIIIGVASGYLVARLAPRAPMRHAMVMGGIGFVLSVLGVAAAATQNLGPLWYPIALAISALPCSYTGAALWLKSAGRRS